MGDIAAMWTLARLGDDIKQSLLFFRRFNAIIRPASRLGFPYPGMSLFGGF
jgi:hypothetical protein